MLHDYDEFNYEDDEITEVDEDEKLNEYHSGLSNVNRMLKDIEELTNFILDKTVTSEKDMSVNQKKDQEIYDNLIKRVNDGLKALRPKNNTRLDVLNNYAEDIRDKEITPHLIAELKEDLDKLEKEGKIKSGIKKAVSKVARFGAAFFVQKEDINKYKKLSKSDKKN